MVNVFISYARKDDYIGTVTTDEEHTYHHDPKRSFTRQLYNALTAAGIEVWWDRESMPGRGLTFLDEIKHAVHECDFLVYVAGEEALESDYVKAEWEYALSLCKPVIPVLRMGEYTDMIPSEMGMNDAPDMRDMAFFDAKVADLIEKLRDVPKLATLHSVPTLPEWYIERGNDVQDLQKTLRADALEPTVITSKKQTIVLLGMGGLGKTTMATAVCRMCDVRYSFPDGIFWLEIGKEPSITTRQGDIGEAFGVLRNEFPDEARGKARLSEVLSNKAVLIVLDDVWDYRHVDAFRVNAPMSRILVTTRNGRIATQLGVDEHAIDTLTVDEGVELIGKRLKQTISPDSPYYEDAIAIVELLEGHTLAISIAAARIREEGADYMAQFRQRIEKKRAAGGSPLPALNMQEDDKNYNLELSLSESYDELSETKKEQFRALGVFAPDGTFDLKAAGALWNIDDSDDVQDLLRYFVKMSLLTEPEKDRYAQHGLLHDYARGLCTEDELADNQHCYFEHYYALYSDGNRNNDEDTHTQIAEDWEQIQTAIDWGLTHEKKNTCNWVNAVQYFMQLQRTSDERLKLLRRTLKTAQDADYKQGQANMFQALGEVHQIKNEYAEAVGRYETALLLYRTIGARVGEANCLHRLGEVHRVKSEYAEAVERYEEALPLYRVIGDRLGEAHCLQALGDVHYVKNEYAEAVGRYEEALPLYRTIGDRLGEANCLQALGDVHRMKNEYAEAVGRYEEALPLYRTIGARLGEANCLKALGDVHRMKNEYAEAVTHYEDALLLGQQIGDFVSQLNSFKGLAYTYQAQDEMDTACEYARQLLTLANSHPFFKEHPVVQGWRETFASWGCEGL